MRLYSFEPEAFLCPGGCTFLLLPPLPAPHIVMKLLQVPRLAGRDVSDNYTICELAQTNIALNPKTLKP